MRSRAHGGGIAGPSTTAGSGVVGPRRHATRSRARRALAALVLLGVLTACQASGAPTPSPAVSALDFTEPGAAEDMIAELTASAGSSNLVLVQVTRESVLVSVLDGTTPVTWAYRDGEAAKVASDLADVDQASFSIDRFNISDVGGLFRAAAGMSGSEENQTLQIVDYSGGRVMMAVTTNPESRTVFFDADGSIMPSLNFHTAAAVSQGISEVTAGLSSVYAVGITSSSGTWSDAPGSKTGTVVRRQRTPKVPVTITSRSEDPDLTPFDPSALDPDVVWEVVRRVARENDLTGLPDFTVTVEDRDGRGPRLYVTVGGTSVVTDLAGTEES